MTLGLSSLSAEKDEINDVAFTNRQEDKYSDNENWNHPVCNLRYNKMSFFFSFSIYTLNPIRLPEILILLFSFQSKRQAAFRVYIHHSFI